MDNLPNVQLTKDPESSWASKVNSQSRANQLTTSSDFKITRSPYGTTIALKNEFKAGNAYMCFRDEYDPSKGYSINDVVQVLPNKDYADLDGNTVKAIPGTWICVVNVPSLYITRKIDAGNPAYKRYVRQADVEDRKSVG